MVKYEYPTFEDWYGEIEITAFRSERFLQHLDLVQDNPQRRNEFVENWLRAAFESARLNESS